MLKKFDMENLKPMNMPMSLTLKLEKDEHRKLVDSTKYQGMISSLLCLTASRLDILFSAGLCACFQSNPKESHLSVVKHSFRYLSGTKHLGL